MATGIRRSCATASDYRAAQGWNAGGMMREPIGDHHPHFSLLFGCYGGLNSLIDRENTLIRQVANFISKYLK
jgi:hypothetical protein